MSLLISIGFKIVPQVMPKKDVNDIADTIDKTIEDNSNDIKSQLNRIILELPDQRVHCDLYQELLYRLHNDETSDARTITTIDNEKLVIKIRQ